MPYSVKAVIIIATAAVVSFFVAELVIPERDAVTANKVAAGEQPPAQAAADDRGDGDIPTVVADRPPESAAGGAALDAKAPKTLPIDTKVSAAADAKAAKTLPVDTKISKTVDVKAGKAEPFDAKTAKTADTKTVAPPPVQPAAPVPPPAQKKTGASYRLEKATLCSAIQNREPQGVANKFSKDAPAVYYYTHLVGARDSTTVIHRWYQNGKLVQTSILPVRSNYWRTHSRRNLLTHTGDVTGQWRVDVVESGTNTVMESASFTIE